MNKVKFNQDMFTLKSNIGESILDRMATAPDSQISESIRNKIKEFASTQHTDHEVFLFSDEVSKLPNTEISSFIQKIFNVREFYLEPEE